MSKAMNETKTEVVLRLDDEEYQTLNQYCLANGFSLTEGAIYLIKEGWLSQEESTLPERDKKGYGMRLFNERLKYMQEALDRWITVFMRTAEANEKMNQRMAELECEMVALKAFTGK